MCKKLIYLILIVLLWGLISYTYIYEAEAGQENLRLAQGGYDKVSPLEVSPTPDVAEDREWREQRTESSETREQPEEAEEKLTPAKGKLPLVGTKPTKIYYKVAVNDKLFISVWRVPDLSLEFIVAPDGKISFPLIGDIDAAGRTLSELDVEITEKLKEYVENPQVSVMVREFAGDKLTVLGEVKSPGIYKFVGQTNIMQVLALAGGFTDRAKSASIVIVREPDDPEKERNLIVANIKNVLKGDLSKNIEVRPNDIIYVSRTFVSNVKGFYDDWIVPLMNSAIDVETWRSIKKSRQHVGK